MRVEPVNRRRHCRDDGRPKPTFVASDPFGDLALTRSEAGVATTGVAGHIAAVNLLL